MNKFAGAFAVIMIQVASMQLQAQTVDRTHRHLDVLPSVGIVFGQTLRATFVNTSEDAVTICPCVHDPDGVIVKQSCITLRSGQTGWLDVSRSESLRADGNRLQLRTGVVLTRATDAKTLIAAGEVIDQESGKTTDWIGAVQGWAANHNETLEVDEER